MTRWTLSAFTIMSIETAVVSEARDFHEYMMSSWCSMTSKGLTFKEDCNWNNKKSRYVHKCWLPKSVAKDARKSFRFLCDLLFLHWQFQWSTINTELLLTAKQGHKISTTSKRKSGGSWLVSEGLGSHRSISFGEISLSGNNIKGRWRLRQSSQFDWMPGKS